MTITKAELATFVGQELQILQSGESLTAEDGVEIESRIDGVRAFLIEEGLCYWTADAIPDAVQRAMTKIIAHECKELFGADYRNGPEGEMQLRKHVAKRASGEAGTAEYF